MVLENSSQDLNFPNALESDHLKKKLRFRKLLLVIVIASVLVLAFAMFNIRLINPPLPGGFP